MLTSRVARSNLCNEFSKLLREMWGASKDGDVAAVAAAADAAGTRKRRVSARLAHVVSPHAFAGAVAKLLPLFQARYEQQDAQEFLRVSTSPRAKQARKEGRKEGSQLTVVVQNR